MIGVAQLRQNASKYLREVSAGSSFTVTDRGKAVARLVPVPKENLELDALIARGLAQPPNNLDMSVLLTPPCAVELDGPSASETLQELRADRLP